MMHQHLPALAGKRLPLLTLSLKGLCGLRRFLLQSLEDLDTSLRKLNSRLFVVRGQPADVFPRLFKVSVPSPREDGEILFSGLSPTD